MKTFKSFVIALFLLMTASRTAHGSNISWFDGKPGTTSTAGIYTGADFSSGTTIPPTINTVTVSATPVAAHAVVTGGGRYVQGTTGVLVTVSTTNDCYEFTGWKIGTKVVDTDSSIDLNVSSNITIVANFQLKSDTIETFNSPTNGGTSIGGGVKNCGTLVTLIATPKPGFLFWGWSSDESASSQENISSYNKIISFTADGPVNAYANFLKGFTVAATASPAGVASITGSHAWGSNATATVMATVTNDCYYFVKWTHNGQTVSTQACYSFSVTNNVTLVAVFSQYAYEITTSSFNSTAVDPTSNTGGTTLGGGLKGCGTRVTLTAIANPGFKFVDWRDETIVIADARVSTSPSFTFTVTGPRTLKAEFAETAHPSITVTAPTLGEKISTPYCTIRGTASDYAGVSEVWYSVNGAQGIDIPSNNTSNHWSNWFVNVTLVPQSNNTIYVQANNTSYLSNKVNFTVNCDAAGNAPVSLSGMVGTAVITDGPTFMLSFDPASMSESSNSTNELFGIGIYSYMLTSGSNAMLDFGFGLPPSETNNGDSLTLNFTDAFDATLSDTNGHSGFVTFAQQADIVPDHLSGATVTSHSLGRNGYTSTNVFRDGMFTGGDSEGTTTAGTYQSAQFSPDSRLIIMTYTAPDSYVGSTNYILATFSANGGATITRDLISASSGGDYFLEVDSSTIQSSDYGTFTVTPGTSTEKYIAPEKISGMGATLSSGGQTISLSFDNATYGQATTISGTKTNQGGVGYYAYTRTSTNKAHISLHTETGNGEEKVNELDLRFSSPTTMTFTNVAKTNSGTVTLAAAPALVAPTLTGYTIKANNPGSTQKTFNFGYGTFVGASTDGNVSGTYSYQPYSPNTALLSSYENDNSPSYIVLTFTSASGGNTMSSSQDGSSIKLGTFTLATTPK